MAVYDQLRHSMSAGGACKGVGLVGGGGKAMGSSIKVRLLEGEASE